MSNVKPWCVVVAATRAIADQYLDTFGLSREVWETRAHGENVNGLQYHRVVVIRPHWRVTADQYIAFETEAAPWMRTVAPDGHFKII